LATVGLYGVTSYMVARRTNEIGIRIALGASRGNVIRLIMRETGMMLAVGLGAGILASLAAGRLVESLLFGLNPNDPLTLGVAAGWLAMIALGASYLPAQQASGVDPTIALRQD
jgi:putative ABC transport system permease protein